MASYVPNSMKGRLLGDDGQISTAVNFKTDTLKFALLTSSHTPDVDADVFFGDINANEVGASGSYSAGGATLTQTVSTSDANNRGVVDATDISFTLASIIARYGVFYKSTGNNATSPNAVIYDFGSNKISTGGTFAIVFHANGLLTLT